MGACLLLLIPTFGCLQAPSGDYGSSAPSAAADSAPWDQLPGVAASFWLEAGGSPLGELTAYRWDPPQAAVAPTGPQGEATRHVVFRPWWIEGGNAALVEWALFAFMLRNGEQVPLFYWWFSAVHVTLDGSPTREIRYPPYFGPYDFSIYTAAPVDGPAVYFVAFVKTRTAARIGLEAVALDHEPPSDKNWTEYLPERSTSVDAHHAAPLAPIGRGQGGAAAFHIDVFRNHRRSVWQNDAFHVREQIDPAAPGIVARRTGLDFDCAPGPGWSLIRNGFRADAFYGNYSAHLATYGPGIRARGTLLQAHEASLASERVFRYPGGNLWGEGRNASGIHTDLAGTGYTNLQWLAFEFVCLGATLAELTGHPAWNGMHAPIGLLDASEPRPAEFWASPVTPPAWPAGAPPTGPRLGG